MSLMAPVVVDSKGVQPFSSPVTTTDTFQNNGRMVLRIKNQSASSITVVADDPVSTSPEAATAFDPDVTLTVPAGEERFWGPFRTSRFNNGSGEVSVHYSATLGVFAEVVDLSGDKAATIHSIFSPREDLLYWSSTYNGHTELYKRDFADPANGVQCTNDPLWDSWFATNVADLTVICRTPLGTLDKNFTGTLVGAGLSASTSGAVESVDVSGIGVTWDLTLPFCFVLKTAGGQHEMIKVTAKPTSTNWTVVRDVLNTGAPAHLSGESLLGGYGAMTFWSGTRALGSITQRTSFPATVDPTWTRYGHPELSPDGTQLVLFAVTTTAFAIVQMSTSTWLSTRVGRTVALAAGGCVDPTWSPDGLTIAFTEGISGVSFVSTISSSGGLNAGYTNLWRQVPIGVVAVANVNIASAPATIDGVGYGTCLLVGQTDPAENGVYNYSSTGAPLTRNAGFDTGAEMLGGACHILGGVGYTNTYWECQNTGAVILGTTPITYSQVRPMAVGPNDPSYTKDGTKIMCEVEAVLPNSLLGYPAGQWDVCSWGITPGPRKVEKGDGNVNTRPTTSAANGDLFYYSVLAYPVTTQFQLWCQSLSTGERIKVSDVGLIPWCGHT